MSTGPVMGFECVARFFAGEFGGVHLLDENLGAMTVELGGGLVQDAHQAEMFVGGALVGLPHALAFGADGKIESGHFKKGHAPARGGRTGASQEGV